MIHRSILLIVLLGVLVACRAEQPNIIIITATSPASIQSDVVGAAPATSIIDTAASSEPTVVIPTATSLPPVNISLSPAPQQALSNPTPNATSPPVEIPSTHTVQAGDTLSGIATTYGVNLDTLLSVNELLDPNVLTVGQVVNLPQIPDQFTPNFKILPDSRLVRGPGSASFDVAVFVAQQPGYIRVATDTVTQNLDNGATFPQTETAAQIVNRVSLEYSVDPRLLLAILEFRAGYLSNPEPADFLIERPLVTAATAPSAEGLYDQLSWAANELNRAYYGWKYRGLVTLTFIDGSRQLYNPELNPGTIAVQYFLSLDDTPPAVWENEIAVQGLYSVYVQYFGDPFLNATEPLVPNNIQQPPLGLPFESGEQWRYTGGPHGGWGSGSAWSSLDFAPGEDSATGVLCFLSDQWITAIAPGIIARAGDGAVVLDLDGDGDEATGWTIMYLHLSDTGRVQAGIRVNTGDRLGRPSCAGGITTATHIHIGRRFNGEWLPADCQACLPQYQVPIFTLGNWQAVGIAGQYYQGFMRNGELQIQAEQGRETTINIISG